MIFDYQNDCYIDRTQLSNGQTACIVFDKYYMSDSNDIAFNVVFAIANKKKQIRQWMNGTGYGSLDMQITGNCGIEGLAWAAARLKEFESICKVRYASYTRKVLIIITGSDMRRYKTYARYLTKHGYREANDPIWGKCLMKSIM